MIDVKVNTDRMRRLAQQSHGILREQVKQAMEANGLGFRQVMVTKNLSGRPGLNAISGQLRASLGHRVDDPADSIGVFIGFYGGATKYVGIHERGGVITANGHASVCGKGRLLAIPVGEAKTASGVLRQGPCEYPKDKSDPGALFFIKTPFGGVLARKIDTPPPSSVKSKRRRKGKTGATKAAKRQYKNGGKRAKQMLSRVEKLGRSVEEQHKHAIQVLFVLKPSVYIPPRLKFRETFKEYLPTMKNRIVKAVRATAKLVKGVH